MGALRLAPMSELLVARSRFWAVSMYRSSVVYQGSIEAIARMGGQQGNRRSFDCASRDETAGGSAQDDSFNILPQVLRLPLPR
jgi:hypothetical protein